MATSGRLRVNGVSLHYELRGQGPPLVLVHGLQGDASTFGSLPSAFADRFTVLTFDQRGSGLSDKPNAAFSTADLADDTATLMRRLDVAPAAVFGTSMGGQVAQQLALQHSSLVDRLILGCTTPGGPHAIPINAASMDYAYTSENLSPEERARRLATVGFSAGWLRQHPGIIDELTVARRQRPLDVMALTRRLEAFREHDAYDALSRVNVPTLVLTGAPDHLIPEGNSRLIAERLPNARLRVLEPAGHLFWIERPVETVAELNAFLLEH